MVTDRKHRDILQWLSKDDFEATHERHWKKRFGNTGKWLLEHRDFVCWKEESNSGLLWCYGSRKCRSLLLLMQYSNGYFWYI